MRGSERRRKAEKNDANHKTLMFKTKPTPLRRSYVCQGCPGRLWPVYGGVLVVVGGLLWGLGQQAKKEEGGKERNSAHGSHRVFVSEGFPFGAF